MNPMLLLLAALIGALIAAVLTFLLLRVREARLAAATAGELARLHAELAAARTAFDTERAAGVERLGFLEQTREELSARFRQLSQDILEEKSQRFAEQNQSNLDAILKPLRERIGTFEQQVKQTYEYETRDRRDLLNQIKELQKLNQQVSIEAQGLASALRGSAKSQGNWGEMVLERVLELSGLEKGREFETQFSGSDSDGRRYRPDAVIRLPDQRDLVIDAKVSLTAYVRSTESADEVQRAQALREHVASLRGHIRELGAKPYAQLKELNAPDFVLMFVPSEAAYIEAIRTAPDLYEDALRAGIGLVSPSTLLPTLRTVDYLWKVERQNRNAQTIAEEAGKLYDQFVLFEESLSDIGDALKKAQDAYGISHRRLFEGRGNLVKRAEGLRKMGVRNAKLLPEALRQASDDEALLDGDGADSHPSA